MGVLLFGVGAVMLGWIAHTNDRGLVLNGGIRFNVDGATLFYWVLAGLFALVVLLTVGIVLTTLVYKMPDIILCAGSVSFPVGFPVKRPFVLPLIKIENISLMEVSGQRILMLQTVGKKHGIALNWLESKEAAQRLESELRERWASVRGVTEYERGADV